MLLQTLIISVFCCVKTTIFGGGFLVRNWFKKLCVDLLPFRQTLFQLFASPIYSSGKMVGKGLEQNGVHCCREGGQNGVELAALEESIALG